MPFELLAGIDMSMVPENYSFCTDLLDLVIKGEVPMSRIDVSRI
jgi:beta-glucosidase